MSSILQHVSLNLGTKNHVTKKLPSKMENLNVIKDFGNSLSYIQIECLGKDTCPSVGIKKFL